MNNGKEKYIKDMGLIIEIYQRFFHKDYVTNSLKFPIIKEKYDAININPENRERYLGMLRNLINNIWKELCSKMHLSFKMPEIFIVSANEIRRSFNSTELDNLSAAYNSESNTIVLSDEFIERLNNLLPIITKDICIGLVTAHEFGHALINQISQKRLSGKKVEHVCDMIAGFTLRKMEEMDLLDTEDKQIGENMFFTMGTFDSGTHGNSSERLAAFLQGYKMDDEAMKEFLSKLIPSYQVIELYQKMIIASLR